MAGANVIGVDLGGTKILAGVIGADGTVHRTIEHPTPTASQAALLDGLEEAVRELLTPEIAAVGFGIPSRIDHRTGIALGAVNIPLRNLRFQDELAARLEIPIGAENDASVAALAEFTLGAARGATDAVMLTLGTGVGGGIVIDSKLFRGWTEPRCRPPRARGARA
jgi:glucokinase